MRNDMRYKLIETGRYGDHSNRASKNRRWSRYRGDIEEAPKRGKMTPSWQDSNVDPRSQTDNFNPLRRYLLSHVGEQWDDVWSDICATNDIRGTMTHHVRLHVWRDIVTLHVFIDTQGNPRDKAVEYGVAGSRTYGLYVHPETGELCNAGERPGYRRFPAQSNVIRDGGLIVKGKLLMPVKGVWYMWDLVPISEVHHTTVTEVQTRSAGYGYRQNQTSRHTYTVTMSYAYVTCARLGLVRGWVNHGHARVHHVRFSPPRSRVRSGGRGSEQAADEQEAEARASAVVGESREGAGRNLPLLTYSTVSRPSRATNTRCGKTCPDLVSFSPQAAHTYGVLPRSLKDQFVRSNPTLFISSPQSQNNLRSTTSPDTCCMLLIAHCPSVAWRSCTSY